MGSHSSRSLSGSWSFGFSSRLLLQYAGLLPLSWLLQLSAAVMVEARLE